VETGRDVLEELVGVVQAPATDNQNRLPVAENRQTLSLDDSLLRHMGYDPCTLDALVGFSGLTAEDLSGMLLQLELEGRVVRLPGAFYQVVVSAQ